jgi:hypothetical protein
MKVVSLISLGLFMLVCSEKAGNVPASSTEVSVGHSSRTAQSPPNYGAPVSWFPLKEQYVTKENDPFLVLVTVTTTSPNELRFELLPPTPTFVRLAPLCSPPGSPFTQVLIVIAPGSSDAGRYEVKLGDALGPTAPAFQILSLNVKVKKVR